jgi:pimeloyl-ACP methyl ester carboxylesterase
MPDSDQAHRSRHHQAFLQPDARSRLLAEGARRLRARLVENGVPSTAIEKYIAVLGNEATMEAALAWYRSPGAIRAPLGAIKVPTLYIWGDAEDTVGSAAAAGTTEFVSGPYQFEILPGVGHFVAGQAPDRVNELLLPHLAKFAQ